MPLLLNLHSVSRYYSANDNKICVLKDISLKIEEGEFIAIIGSSGSGKSTLMNILGCLDMPSTGSYEIAGKNVVHLNNDQLAILRRERFGFIFQRYHLLPHLTTLQNVMMPAVYTATNKAYRLQRAITLLSDLGLSERLHYLPSQLSGGQQQRVSIARALMNGGKIILADEPTGALDTLSSLIVLDTFKKLNLQGHTIILVTHNPEIAAQAKRIVELKDGEIINDRVQIQATIDKDKTKDTQVNNYLINKNEGCHV